MLRKELYQQYKNQSGIYKLTINNKFYIGSSKNIGIRLSKHLLDLERNLHHSIYLQRAWNKYQNINIEIIEICDNTIEREQYYINTLQPHFNLCKNATNCNGIKRSENHKNKISEHHKNNKEYWDNVYANRIINHSDETKEKIRTASIGRQFSKETRNKISKAKVLSNEIILKIKQLRLSGVSISKTAQQLGISISSIKRYQY